MKAVAVIAAFFLISFVSHATQQNEIPYISDKEAYIFEGGVAFFCPEERGALTRAVMPNGAVMFPIENASRAEDLRNLKVFTLKWEMGEEFTSAPYIEYRMLYEADGVTQKGYRYVAVLPVLSLAGEQKANVRGVITLGEHKQGNSKRNFSFVIRDDGINPYIDSYICDGKDFPLEFDQKTHQVCLNFGDYARFSFDAFGQSPLNVGFSTEPFTDLIYKYPRAKLSFLNFLKAPVFNKEGDFVIFVSKESYIYEVTPTGLEEANFEFSEEKNGFVSRTRRLSRYVISDKALGNPLKKVKIFNPPTGVREE